MDGAEEIEGVRGNENYEIAIGLPLVYRTYVSVYVSLLIVIVLL